MLREFAEHVREAGDPGRVLSLIHILLRLGADRARLVARIAGGARMFDVLPELEFMDIGARNAEAVSYTHLSR